MSENRGYGGKDVRSPRFLLVVGGCQWRCVCVRACVEGVGGCRTHLLQAPLERWSVWKGFSVALDEPERPPCLNINLSWLEIFASESNWWYKSAESAGYLRFTTQHRGPQRGSLIHASAGSKSWIKALGLTLKVFCSHTIKSPCSAEVFQTQVKVPSS